MWRPRFWPDVDQTSLGGRNEKVGSKGSEDEAGRSEAAPSDGVVEGARGAAGTGVGLGEGALGRSESQGSHSLCTRVSEKHWRCG